MYLTLLDKEALVTVKQGMCDVSEHIEEVTVTEAIEIANDFNIGKFHPDVYVAIMLNHADLFQVVQNNVIIGFSEQF